MVVERTNNEFIVRLPLTIDIDSIQRFLNFARYKELVSNFKVSQNQVDELVSDIKAEWNKENQHKKK